MYSPLTTVLLASTSILSHASATYVLSDDYSGPAFFQGFSFFTNPDPTNGHVKFQSLSEANATGLAGLMDGGNATRAIYMGVDSVSEAPGGRGSVRVQSEKTYQHALVIADIVHMPGGVCGTWPAFWMVGDNWPRNGEIDIVEGVNDQTSNQMTLHTSSGPRISHAASAQNTFTGDVITANCDVNAPGQSTNAGCGISANDTLTFGSSFNAAGGGVYATEWTSSFIKIWFFPRGSFPLDVASATPNPSANWGPPTSLFAGNFSMDEHFRDLRIVFDTTFCGDWAGNTWSQTECGSLAATCEEYVSNNAAAFEEAYWAVNTLQVFQDDGTKRNETKAVGSSSKADIGAGVEVVNSGRFVKNAVTEKMRLDLSKQIDGGKTQGKWVQSPNGWEARKGGGAVLPRKN